VTVPDSTGNDQDPRLAREAEKVAVLERAGFGQSNPQGSHERPPQITGRQAGCGSRLARKRIDPPKRCETGLQLSRHVWQRQADWGARATTRRPYLLGAGYNFCWRTVLSGSAPTQFLTQKMTFGIESHDGERRGVCG
jgi:hypothetical protein